MSKQQSQSFSKNPNNSGQINKINQVKSFRCYLRTSDMKCKIENIRQDQSVRQLKMKINELFRLNVKDLQLIRLVVNQVQLTQQSSLSQHLYNNVIIHILIIYKNNPSQSQSQQQSIPTPTLIQITLKQPPIDCPIFNLHPIPSSCSILQLKQQILSYYKYHYQLNQISLSNMNDLYLVYSGRIMKQEKKLVKDYGYEENGIIYVVNGKEYVKEVTKQEAERRMKQVREGGERQMGKQNNNYYNNYNYNYNQQQQEQQQKQQQQPQAINIIQTIIDIDDQVYEGIQPNKQLEQNQKQLLSRSHKIIKRYDSIRHEQKVQDQQQEERKINVGIQEICQKMQKNDDEGMDDQKSGSQGQKGDWRKNYGVMKCQYRQKVMVGDGSQLNQQRGNQDLLDFKCTQNGNAVIYGQSNTNQQNQHIKYNNIQQVNLLD